MAEQHRGIADGDLERVKRQNAAPIGFVIGNPPYDAWPSDHDACHPNRPYRRVDERIGQIWRRLGRAQNTSALAMRWHRAGA